MMNHYLGPVPVPGWVYNAVHRAADPWGNWRRMYEEAGTVIAELKAENHTFTEQVEVMTRMLERIPDVHMQFGLLNPDGTTEQLPCADWCYACRLDKAVERAEKAEATLARVRTARGRLRSALVAVSDRLMTPYIDLPERTPWSQFVQPAMRALDAALEQPKESDIPDQAETAGQHAALTAIVGQAEADRIMDGSDR